MNQLIPKLSDAALVNAAVLLRKGKPDFVELA
jgi:hypothetical protein